MAGDEHIDEGLSEDIIRRWDPERLLRLVARRAGKGERLDHATRSRYESRLGVDLGDVRIYTGAFAEEVARRHAANAVTIGTTGMILMGGRPEQSLATAAGQALLAHELTHVAQEQRSLHRQATFGESTPLATEQHEEEAEEAEAVELAAAQGRAPGESQGAADERKAVLRQKVIDRVLEMAAEDVRVGMIRNGESRWRP